MKILRTFIAIIAALTVSIACPLPASAQQKAKRPKVGLVLSGGGAKGIAHVGVLKVLEEAGIQVDYIAGTSMGSVVGALYAIGYDAAALEKFALEENWTELLNDEISLKDIPIDEKLESGKYILSFALKGLSLELPKGLIKGQKLSQRLSAITLNYHQYHDFNKLPIPFHCVATDIESGDEVIIDKGFLPEALRASMSIPSVFTPIEIDGKLLVDGGVVKNFPVEEVKAMGADIIIGVDVGAPLLKKGEFDSVADILDQSVSFLNAKVTREQRNHCDILIMPDIKGIGGTDFGNAADIIKKGEDAARAIFPKLTALAAKLGKYPPEERKKLSLPDPEGTIRIDEIRIEGLKNVSSALVMNRLGLRKKSSVTLEELNDSISSVYGSQFFERVNYRLIPTDEGNILLLMVEEKNTNLVRFGLSYDSYMNAAIYVNLTMRNMLLMGSLLSVSARLSEYPGAEVKYYIHTGWRPGIGVGLDLKYNQYRGVTYFYSDQQEGIKSTYDLMIFSGRFSLQAIYSNAFALGLGVEKEYNIMSPDINTPLTADRDLESLNYLAFIKFDNLDRYYYPRSGFQADVEGAVITDHAAVKRRNNFHEFYKVSGGLLALVPLHRRVSLMLSARLGTIRGTQVPNGYLFYCGGLYTFNRNFFAFPGVRVMELSGRNVSIYQGGIQLEPWRDIFIIPRVSGGKAGEYFRDLFDNTDFFWAYGATIGYNSIIGPIEATFMYGGISQEFMAYVNIGFRY